MKRRGMLGMTIALLMAAVHFTAAMALVNSQYGTEILLDEDLNAIKILLPFVGGIVLVLGEIQLVGIRATFLAWTCTAVGGLIVSFITISAILLWFTLAASSAGALIGGTSWWLLSRRTVSPIAHER